MVRRISFTREKNLTNNPMWSASAREKSSNSHKGKIFSAGQKKKLSLASKSMWQKRKSEGKVEEWKSSVREKKVGVKLSDSHKKSLSVGQKKRFERERMTGLRGPKKIYLKKGSEELKKLISERTKEAMSRPEVKEKVIKSLFGSKRRVGKFHTEECKKTISRKISEAVLNGAYDFVGNRRYEYKSIWFKSSWEVLVAKWLDSQHVRWKYESKAFPLNCGTYIPDFELIDTGEYLEVKGYLKEISKRKMNQFVESGNVLYYIDDMNDISLNKKWGV